MVDLLVDRRHAPEVGGRLVEPTLIAGDDAQLVQGRGDARMDPAVDPLLGGQRRDEQRARLVPLVGLQQRAGEDGLGRGGLRMVRPVPAAEDLQRLAVPPLGLR